MLKSVTAFTNLTEAKSAATILLEQLDQQLHIYRPQVGIIYSSFAQDNEFLAELCSELTLHYNALQLIGSSITAGMTDDKGYQQQGIFIVLLVSDTLTFRTGIIDQLSHQQKNKTLKVALQEEFSKRNQTNNKNELCLIYSSYFGVDTEGLIADLQTTLGEHVGIFGGSSTDFFSPELLNNPSDDHKFPIENSYQLFAQAGQCKIFTQAMVYLHITGEVEYDFAYSFGWLDDEEKYDLQADVKEIIEIEGQNPISFLQGKKHPLTSSASSMLEYPLWIHEPDNKAYLRDFIVTNQQKLEVLGAPLPQSFAISFSFPDAQKILKEYREAIHQLNDNYELCISFACTSRVMTLGQQIKHEASYAALALSSTPIIGGYFFGEFFPPRKHQTSQLNSCSHIVLLIRSQKQDHTLQNRQESFGQQRLLEKNRELKELKEQLAFFEKTDAVKENIFLRDVLGVILNRSVKSISAYSEELQTLFQESYDKKPRPSYPISRNRIIEKINPLKKDAKKKFRL
ncbi:MAG: Unknown protein [uncultured Thiotrichaceae bacterium]|uniref:Uncharacterized protein n=1 Tax=uncultured Thiotrichaceae bacterium TaxID=298394 RepID=A0A6S6TPN9_9GAMM|nr:MAG: Unknown protein [uncultured Thiotrichaceae bacterium]